MSLPFLHIFRKKIRPLHVIPSFVIELIVVANKKMILRKNSKER